MKKNNLLWLLFILPFLIVAGIHFYKGKQTPEKSFLIGVINPNQSSQMLSLGFIDGLTKSGKKEGWRLSFIRMKDDENVDVFLEKIVSQPVNLIYSVTTPATRKVLKATKEKNIPGIFTMLNPIRSKVINNLSQPGGNVTGVQLHGSVPKALDYLLTIAPETKHLFVPIKFDTKAAKQSLDDLKKTADSIGIRLTVSEVVSVEQLDVALDSIPADADAIFLLHSIFISTHAKKIADIAIEKKLPTAAATWTCRDGVLISYSNKHFETGMQASRLAYLVLNGGNPAVIPSEIANFFLGINLKTASQIGLSISDNVLAHANEIVRQ